VGKGEHQHRIACNRSPLDPGQVSARLGRRIRTTFRVVVDCGVRCEEGAALASISGVSMILDPHDEGYRRCIRAMHAASHQMLGTSAAAQQQCRLDDES
jgi:hypothetical protein